MHVVTISATYGAGGALVGPEVAERLGVPFVDRAIPVAVADDLNMTLDDALSRDEQVGGWLSRLLTATAPLSAEWMIGPDHPRTALLPDSAVLRCTEGVIRRTVEGAGGVILGRAAAIVLRDHPGAFHVRLDGDPDRRVRQAMTLQGMTEREAREALGRNDKARDRLRPPLLRRGPREPAALRPGDRQHPRAVEGVHRADRRGRGVVRPATHLTGIRTPIRRAGGCAAAPAPPAWAGPPASASSRVSSALTSTNRPASSEAMASASRAAHGSERSIAEKNVCWVSSQQTRVRTRDHGRRAGHVQEQAELADHGPGPARRHGPAVVGRLDDVHASFDQQVERRVRLPSAEQGLARPQADRPQAGAEIVDGPVVQLGERREGPRVGRIDAHSAHTPRRTVALATRPNPTTYAAVRHVSFRRSTSPRTVR